MGSGSAPDLVECVTDVGTIAVLPGDPSTCAAVGFAHRSGAVGNAEAQVVVLAETIRTEGEGRCLTVDQARELIEEAFDRAELNDWTIELGTPLDSVRTCAGTGLDEQRRVVLIVGVPGA